MDAPCKIQGSIHVFRLVNNMCPGKWVHISISEGLNYYFLLTSYHTQYRIQVYHLHYL